MLKLTNVILSPIKKARDIMRKVPILKDILLKCRRIDNRYFAFLDAKVYPKLKKIKSIAISKFVNFFVLPKSDLNISNLSENDFMLLSNHVNIAKKFRTRFIVLLLIIFICLFFCSNLKDKSKIVMPDYENSFGYIAHVTIDGVITKDAGLYESLRKIRDNKSIKAVILSVDSPGGSVEPSEKIYRLLAEINKEKPLVVCMESVAASGGYMISMAARRIFAMRSTITGSIGVYTQSYEITELAKKIGVSAHYVKTSPIKGSPHPFEKPSDEIIAMEKNIIASMHSLFKEIVSDSRGITGSDLEFISNGQIFTGDMALKYKLIDEIGDEKLAEKWLKDSGLVDSDMQVKIVKFDSSKNDNHLFMKSLATKFASYLSSFFAEFFSSSKNVSFMY